MTSVKLIIHSAIEKLVKYLLNEPVDGSVLALIDGHTHVLISTQGKQEHAAQRYSLPLSYEISNMNDAT